MFLNLKKTLFLVGSSALLFTACGDDGGGTPDAAVAPVIDADTTDAMPDPTFLGSVSVAEVKVTDPEAANIGGLYGSGIVVNFDDPFTVIPPHPDFPQPVAACKVTVTDIAGGDVVPDGDDGGIINVTGTGAGEFNCAFNATLDDYLCATADAAGMGALPIGTDVDGGAGMAPNPTVTLNIPGADFSTVNYVGMYIVLAGFGDAQVDAITFPILAVPADDTLVLANVSQIAGNNQNTLAAAGTYFTTIGDPIPRGAGDYDTFLDDGTADIVISKGAATNAPAFSTTLKANGAGFTLADDSALAHDFPASGAVRYSCDEAQNGSCGTFEGTLKGLVIFGETTDAVLPAATPADFKEMPDPVAKYATFSCSGLGAKEMTVPAEAVALIMGTTPTRIKTTVTSTNASIEGKVNVVLAHGVVGFSDAPFTVPTP